MDPIKPSDVKPAGTVAPVTPEPAKTVQATPAAVPPAGATTPNVAKPGDGLVPLPALQEERSKRQALESEVAELKRMVQQQQHPQQFQPQQQQFVDPQVQRKQELEKMWEEDPRKAVQTEIMYAMEYRDYVEANLEQQADYLAKQYPDFNNYRSSVLAQIRSLPLGQRGNPGVLEASYFMVRGQNLDTLLSQREADMMEKYRRGEISASQLGVPQGTSSASFQPTGVQLSDEQRKVARAMGMSEEGYAKHMPQVK